MKTINYLNALIICFINKLAKPSFIKLNLTMAFVAIIAFGYSQAKYDTIWGHGYFKVMSNLDNQILEGVNITLRAEDVPHLEGGYAHHTVSSQYGWAEFEIPVYIDSDVGLSSVSSNRYGIFPNIGSKLNVIVPDNSYAELRLYDLQGRLVLDHSLSVSCVYDIGFLPTGTYIYQLLGETFRITDKFVKINNAYTVASSRNNDSNKSVMSYDATYWVSWEYQDYKTDSILMDFEDGDNETIDLIIPYYRELVFWEDWIIFKNSETGDNVYVGVEIYAWQETIDMEVWDSVFYAFAEDGLAFDVSLPVYIDTIVDGYIAPGEKSADYWVKWVPEQGEFSGYHTDSAIITINQNDEYIIIPIDPVTPLPQNQDLTGRVLHQIGQNVTTYPLSTVYITNSSTGAVTSIEADENANWVFPNAPLNTTFLVSYEGNGSEWSPEDVAYTTPVYNENTWSASDTIHSGLTGIIVQPDDETTAEHLAQQGGHGTNQDIIEYYLIPNSFTSIEEENVHNYFLNLTADENQAYVFTESTEPLNGTGITLSHGTNNTDADEADISTSWNHHLYPAKSAITTTNADSYIVFVHEVKQALGFQQVAWGPDYDESVMETPVQNYSQEDIAISKLVSTYYYDAYQNNTHGVPLSYLTPGVSKSTKEKAVPLQIQVDNANYHFK